MSSDRVDDLADVRAGDKGDTLILAVRPRRDEDFERLAAGLTPEAVARHFQGRVVGDVRRELLPRLPALVLTLPGVLGGGVTGALTLDGHGKTLSYHLLTMPIA